MSVESTGDGSNTLYSERYGQTFHSHHGAVAESRHVFLEASGIAARLAAGQACRVLEMGFGTGLNCWLTADVAVSAAAPLKIISLEQNVLPGVVLEELDYASALQHPELLERYLAFRAELPETVGTGRHEVLLAANVRLTLLVGEATGQELPKSWADVVYHDAFSPEANPELWSGQFLSSLRDALVPGGVLVTYSVKGEVRRRLQELGFAVNKQPGPLGGKREMLVARWSAARTGM